MKCAAALALLVGFATGCAPKRPPPQVSIDPTANALFYEHMVEPAAPGGPECCTDVLALRDINADGYVDIVIGSQEAKGASLVWYEYPSWTRHEVGRGEFTTDGKALDFDGDGDADIVIGDLSAGIVWFEQKAPAEPWVRHAVSPVDPRASAPDYAHDIVAADIDADGHMDVVTNDKRRVRIYYGTAEDSFRVSDVTNREAEGLQVSDLDGDGDLDILFGNEWIEQRREEGAGAGGVTWTEHDIDSSWTPESRVQVGDVDGDGKADVVLSGSEGQSRLAWFGAPELPTGAWVRHYIGDVTYTGAHSLLLEDFNLDGRPDLLVAEMHTSPAKRIDVYLNEDGGRSWERLALATHGSHNMQAADFDGDGDIDFAGKNYGGLSRFVEYWENRSADLRHVPAAAQTAPSTMGSAWAYQPVDTARPESDHHKFGLVIADLDADGRQDVVAGGSAYLDPGATGQGPWPRISLGKDEDVISVTTQRVNGWPLVIAVRSDSLDVIEAGSPAGDAWGVTPLHALPDGRSQGWVASATATDGSYDLFFTHGTALYRLRVGPAAPQKWAFSRVYEGVQEEGVALADLDGDGDQDLAVVDSDGRHIRWLETDGDYARRSHLLGASLRWKDRVATADVNRDGRVDVIFTEETRDWDYNARLVWLEAPSDRVKGQWRPHVVTVLRSINSLDVADLDGDGDVDMVAAEHTDMRPGQTASDNFTGVFLNRGDGSFTVQQVELGSHSSHLGAKIMKDGDGNFAIVSVAWEQSCCVHRWTRAAMAAAAEAR